MQMKEIRIPTRALKRIEEGRRPRTKEEQVWRDRQEEDKFLCKTICRGKMSENNDDNQE